MIGRDRELKRLQEALQSVISERECRLLTVVGDAGIGKSCLLNEFQKWAELFPDRKSTRLNSSHLVISYAVFCLKKKNKILYVTRVFLTETSTLYGHFTSMSLTGPTETLLHHSLTYCGLSNTTKVTSVSRHGS